MDATVEANEKQKLRMVRKITGELGEDLHGKTIAILGITFKPKTDDMRDSPSLVILPELVKCGAKLRVTDPQGKKEGLWRFKDISENLTWCTDIYSAVEQSDATVILTEWHQFRAIDFTRYEALGAKKVLFDLRNIYRRDQMEQLGFVYHGVGV